ncbi:hydrophobic protein [Streptomyces sp. NPDC088358]|uniref:hydrophobic protein n=1 Tax=Streptomyces sp. NPDC088358 TaxID=3365857 RepID=UPI00380597E2
MVPLTVVLLLALLLFGAGFAVQGPWWIAVIVPAVWLLGSEVRPGAAADRRGRRYHW